MTNKVFCRSSATYAERPIAFEWQRERLEVEKIEAEWRTPEGKYYRVRTTDGRAFELVYGENNNEWSIIQQ